MSARTRPGQSGFFGICRENLRACGQAAVIIFCAIACAGRADLALAQQVGDPLPVTGLDLELPKGPIGFFPPLVPPTEPTRLSFYSCLSAQDKDMLSGTYKEVLRTFKEFNDEFSRYEKADKSFREANDRVESNQTVKQADNQRRDQLLEGRAAEASLGLRKALHGDRRDQEDGRAPGQEIGAEGQDKNHQKSRQARCR